MALAELEMPQKVWSHSADETSVIGYEWGPGGILLSKFSHR